MAFYCIPFFTGYIICIVIPIVSSGVSKVCIDNEYFILNNEIIVVYI